MKKLKTIRAVYSYYFPEIRKIISDITKDFPHGEFLKSISPGLDDYEKPIIQKMIKFYEKDVVGFEGFQYRYPTSGSSEGIYHLLSRIKKDDPESPIYTLEGEYEGYRECAAGLGLKVQEISEDTEAIRSLPKGYWFVSNPSGRAGNILPNNLINQIADLGHKVVVDMAYLGMTRRQKFDLSHPNIVAVLTSMSKPFGLFYYRVGFTFTREPVKTLYATKWFKNILSLIIADKVFSTFTADYIYQKYAPVQKEILEQIKKETGIELRRSDVLILAHLTEKDFEKLTQKQKKMVKPFKRSIGYRFCLTQYFLVGE
jgi:histidinol-phosphate/aromatic aminotransferase/cobyric acid decarboxylase-like protein